MSQFFTSLLSLEKGNEGGFGVSENFEISTLCLKGRYSSSELRDHEKIFKIW